MTDVVEPERIASVVHAEPPAGPPVRVAAFLGGAVLLLCGLVVSLGTVLAALIGMGVVNNVWRRKRRPTTRAVYWIAAGAAMSVVLLVAAGALFATAPAGSFGSAMHAADSASVAAGKKPPPELLRRFGPMYDRRYEPSAGTSRVLAIVGAVWGLGFVVGSLAAVYGTLAWGAAMLLALAVTGRWPGTTTHAPPTG